MALPDSLSSESGLTITHTLKSNAGPLPTFSKDAAMVEDVLNGPDPSNFTMGMTGFLSALRATSTARRLSSACFRVASTSSNAVRRILRVETVYETVTMTKIMSMYIWIGSLGGTAGNAGLVYRVRE